VGHPGDLFTMQNGCRGAGRLAQFRDHLVLADQAGEHVGAGARVSGHEAAGGSLTRPAAGTGGTRHGATGGRRAGR